MTDLTTAIARLAEFRRAIEDDGVAGEAAGVDMWREVAQHIAALRQPPGRA